MIQSAGIIRRMGDPSYVARFGWTPRDLLLLPFSLFCAVFGAAIAVTGVSLWGALAGLMGAGYLVMWTISWLSRRVALAVTTDQQGSRAGPPTGGAGRRQSPGELLAARRKLISAAVPNPDICGGHGPLRALTLAWAGRGTTASRPPHRSAWARVHPCRMSDQVYGSHRVTLARCRHPGTGRKPRTRLRAVLWRRLRPRRRSPPGTARCPR
jgi:hypothetical protein